VFPLISKRNGGLRQFRGRSHGCAFAKKTQDKKKGLFFCSFFLLFYFFLKRGETFSARFLRSQVPAPPAKQAKKVLQKNVGARR